MLSDEVLEKVSERLVDRIESANTYILKKIGSNIDEIGKLGYSDAQKIAQMMKYGGDYEKIIKKLASVTNLNEKDIRDIFDEVAKSEYEFAEQFYRFKNINYVPYNENRALREQVEALASITQRNISNMMKPNAIGYGIIDKVSGNYTLVDLQQAYYNLIDEAVFSVGQGKETFNEAMTRQIKEMISGGLKVIYNSTYVNKEGNIIHRSRRLDSAIRMTMKDGLRTLHNEMQDRFGNEFGANGVEVSVHLNPAPDHADMQGHQFKKEEYEKLQLDGVAKDYKGRVIDIHRELKDGTTTEDFRPVSQYNCYHYVFSIVLGVSKPAYSQEDLDRINELNNRKVEIDGKEYTGYECTQLQRKLETKIREQKDAQIIARAGNKKDLVIEAQQKITELTNKYKEISDKAGLKTKMDRLKVSGYRYIPYKKKDVDVVNKVENKPVVNVKVNKDKNNKIFISKEENERIANYYINTWEYNMANDKWSMATQRFKGRYEELKQQQKEGFKDEEIDLSTIDGCKQLLKKVNGVLDGDEINNTDVRLLGECSRTIYDITKKSPGLMEDTTINYTVLRAQPSAYGSEVASARGSLITLNNEYFKDYDTLYKMSKEYTELHSYLDGKKHSWWSEVAEGYETREVITHEFGHSLHSQITSRINGKKNKIGFDIYFKKYGTTTDTGYEMLEFGSYKKIRRDLIYEPVRRVAKKEGITQKDVIDKYVSQYGKSSYDEMFAETFANSQLGKSNPLGDELINYLKELGEWEE